MRHAPPIDAGRRRFHRYLLAGTAGVLLTACGADQPSAPVAPVSPAADSTGGTTTPGGGASGEGVDWVAIDPPQPGDSPGRIEVLEFFSYGCVHCANFNPLIAAWEHALPADVAFRRVPVTFGRAAWRNLARLYYTLDSLGELARLDQAVFDAIHTQREPLNSDAEITAWAARNGIDAQRFAAVFDGFAMQGRIARADQLARDYRVESVPLLTIDGRYAVVGRQARRLEDLLVIADDLIARVRAHRG